jgi:hypothetical protein
MQNQTITIRVIRPFKRQWYSFHVGRLFQVVDHSKNYYRVVSSKCENAVNRKIYKAHCEKNPRVIPRETAINMLSIIASLQKGVGKAKAAISEYNRAF